MPTCKPGVALRKSGAPVTLDTIHGRCDEVGDCWIWRGAVSHGTAPAINIGGRSTSVRRFVADLLGRQTKGRYCKRPKGADFTMEVEEFRLYATEVMGLPAPANRAGPIEPTRSFAIAAQQGGAA